MYFRQLPHDVGGWSWRWTPPPFFFSSLSALCFLLWALTEASYSSSEILSWNGAFSTKCPSFTCALDKKRKPSWLTLFPTTEAYFSDSKVIKLITYKSVFRCPDLLGLLLRPVSLSVWGLWLRLLRLWSALWRPLDWWRGRFDRTRSESSVGPRPTSSGQWHKCDHILVTFR